MLHHRELCTVLTPFGADMHVAENERLGGYDCKMMTEPFGGAAGTGFLWEDWMDGWTRHQEAKEKDLQLLMLHDVNVLSAHLCTDAPCCYGNRNMSQNGERTQKKKKKTYISQ